MRSIDILRRVYGVRPGSIRAKLAAVRLGAVRWIRRHNWRLALGGAALGVWMLTHVYYYNRLTLLEFDLKVAWAQVETVQEKRAHIQRNLVQLLRYYAAYEERVLEDVTRIRSADDTLLEENAEPTADRSWKLLGELTAVAEAYPKLELTTTVQHFSQTIIATESEIAMRIQQYNVAVNMYTSVLHMFPGNLFGKAIGFETYEFYRPDDLDVLEFRQVQP